VVWLSTLGNSAALLAVITAVVEMNELAWAMVRQQD
jgi:hypothetical protein